MQVIAIFSVKGGVGKSSCAVNLAYAAAVHGRRRTLLWDLDVQGASSFMLGADPDGGTHSRWVFGRKEDLASSVVSTSIALLDLIPADESLRQLGRQLYAEQDARLMTKLLKPLASKYDRVVLDCPPGFSEIAEQAFQAADLIVAPLSPSPLAERTFEMLSHHLAERRSVSPPVLPVFSMVDRRRKAHCEAIARHPQWLRIPLSSAVEQMGSERKPLGLFAPWSEPARSFCELYAAVERALRQAGPSLEEPAAKLLAAH